MLRILHTADLHLGKPFGRFPEAVRARLMTARETLVPRLAAAARASGATVVVMAGDTFDSEAPAPRLVRLLRNQVAAAPDLIFVVLPGNHDSLVAGPLWANLAQDRPVNLILAVSSAPLPVGDHAVLLPAPCSSRRPAVDPTQVMDQPTAPGTIRLGLAHGSVADFGAEVGAAPISADRAARSGLDYLALGDWHGLRIIGPKTAYCGTPEPDSFRHGLPGQALCVTLPGPGAPPLVVPVTLGTCLWVAPVVDFHPAEEALGRLPAVLPPVADRGSSLVEVTLRGQVSLPTQPVLDAELARLADDFLWWSVVDRTVAEVDPTDLDAIDRAGALRLAADRLWALAQGPDGAVAAAALRRLYALAADR